MEQSKHEIGAVVYLDGKPIKEIRCDLIMTPSRGRKRPGKASPCYELRVDLAQQTIIHPNGEAEPLRRLLTKRSKRS